MVQIVFLRSQRTLTERKEGKKERKRKKVPKPGTKVIPASRRQRQEEHLNSVGQHRASKSEQIKFAHESK